jgi:two-component system CheB/CheR fusion protein
VILSGGAHDGTRGMKTIKHEGGLTFAQDSSAKFGSMPISAVAAGAVDFILSPKEIAQEISRLSKHPFIKPNAKATRPIVEKAEGIDNNNPDLKNILNLLHKAHGVDFSQYKMTTIKRRILRRMLLYKIKSLREYVSLLISKSDEPDILYQDLLINVTSFFRDTETHHYLKTTILPKLLKRKRRMNRCGYGWLHAPPVKKRIPLPLPCLKSKAVSLRTSRSRFLPPTSMPMRSTRRVSGTILK